MTEKKLTEVTKELYRRERYRYKQLTDKDEVTEFIAGGDDLYRPHFWIMEGALLRESTSEAGKYKVHVNEPGQWDSLACSRKVDECTYLGSTLPTGLELCKRCLKNRPELAFMN